MTGQENAPSMELARSLSFEVTHIPAQDPVIASVGRRESVLLRAARALLVCERLLT
jgi:hypothetical protein